MDEISRLVDETFGLLDDPEFNSGLSNPFIEMPDEVPGVLYHLQLTSGTFVLRIFATDNLQRDFSEYRNNFKILRKLKIDPLDDESLGEVKFFECDRLEFAKMIKTELSNNRFPLYEENVINVSDPGYSWWLDGDESSLKIYFKLSRTENLNNLVKLGPLGNPKLAMKRFAMLQGYFSAIFPLSMFASAHGKVEIQVEEGNPLFWSFQKLLIEGDADFEFWKYLRQLEIETEGTDFCLMIQKANYYLMQLGVMRKFWSTVQNEIKSQTLLQ